MTFVCLFVCCIYFQVHHRSAKPKVKGMNNIKLINVNELANILLNLSAQTMVSVVTMTQPDLKAKNKDGEPNPFKAGRTLKDGFTISKINKANGTINGDYDQMVINKVKKDIISERIAANQPPLTADELATQAAARPEFGTSWHTRKVEGGRVTCLSVHKKDASRLYLGFVYRSKGTSEYISLDGTMVDAESVYPFLSEASDYSNQNTSEGNEVRYVVFALASILEIALNGERYRILDNFANKGETARNNAWQIAEAYLEGQKRMQKV